MQCPTWRQESRSGEVSTAIPGEQWMVDVIIQYVSPVRITSGSG